KQPPKPQGSKAQSTAADRAFRCADERWLAVSATSEGEWRALCTGIGQEALLDDARFATNADRVDHRDELNEVLEPVFASMPLDYWVMELGKVGLTWARVMRWDELRRHEQVLETDYILPIDTREWGRVWTGGAPWRFSRTPAAWFAVPGIGEHNEEILR